MQSVVLHVYDLSGGIAAQMSPALLGKRIDGIWHTGVVVFGKEYFYGGGIQAVAPTEIPRLYGLRPVQVLPLGTTRVTQAQFEAFLREISARFTTETYDLIHHNCNNFSDEVARFLLQGTGIPKHILDLPHEALSTPLGAMLRPMLEGMQQQMNATPGAQPFSVPLAAQNTAPPVLPQGSSDNTTATSNPSTSSFSSRKYIVAVKPSLHFERIVARAKSVVDACSPQDVAQLDQLIAFINATDQDPTKTESTSLHLSWWKLLLQLLQHQPSDSKVLFAALGIFRVLLLFPVELDGLQTIRRQCLDRFFDLLDARLERMSNPLVLMAFSVLINALASVCAREMVVSNLLRVLPVVFPTLTKSSHAEVRVMGATVVYNCCLALQLEEEVVLMTLLSGCSEVLADSLGAASSSSSFSSNGSSNNSALTTTQEKLLIALGVLLKNFQLAKAISMQIGLGQVLARVALGSSLGPLTNEVLALL